MAGSLWVSFITDNSGNQVLLDQSADGVNWAAGTGVSQTSKFAPALASFNPWNETQWKLFVAFIANNSGNAVLVCSSADGVNWSANTDISQTSKAGPSLAAFNGKLYVAFIADESGNQILVCSSYDGISWTNNTNTGQSSPLAPSLAVFNGQLFVAFISNDSRNAVLVCSSADGIHWSNYTNIGQTTQFAPSLAVFNGQLFVAFISKDSRNAVLVCSSADGVNWSSNTDIGQTSKFGPSLAAFNGQLFVSFIADNSGNAVLVCSSADGVNWSGNTDINQAGQFAPSLAASPFSMPSLASVVSVPMFQQPGTLVTITGTGFGPTSTVAFGSGAPTNPQSVSSSGTSLVVEVPASATSGQATITVPGGTVKGPNFIVDSYRNTRGFSFINNTTFIGFAGSSYSYDDATALFGAAQTSFNFFGFLIENPLMSLFRAMLDLILHSGGQCFGFALGSLRFITGGKSLAGLPLQATTFEPLGPDVWMLDGPALSATPSTNVSPSLAAYIHQQQIAQFSQESINQLINFHATVNTSQGLRDAIMQAFNAGGQQGIGVIIGMDPQIGNGHAVVAYEIVESGDTIGGDFNILVYNPDVPFATGEDTNSLTLGQNASSSVINVMLDGTWSFNYFSWTGNIFDITVIPWNAIPVQPTVPWAEILAGLTLLWFVFGDAGVTQVSDGQGRRLLTNGRWNVDPATSLPGVRPMPAFGGLGKKSLPAFVGNRLETLTHTITGNGTGNYGFNWIGAGCGMKLEDLRANPGETDRVITGPALISLVPGSDKGVTATFIRNGSGSSDLPRTVILNTTASAQAAVTLSFDREAGTFIYSHEGATTRYSVQFSSYDQQGKPVTCAGRDIAVRTGDRHLFLPDWANLATGAGKVTLRHSDGTETTLPLA